MKDYVKGRLLDAGAVAVGFAKAGAVSDDLQRDYFEWIAEGMHAEMDYLKRHLPLKSHTDSVLPGAKTVISMAFGYKPDSIPGEPSSLVAPYARVEDYHLVIRERLMPVVEEFKGKFGGEWRICIDSAPVAERYWALQAGLGRKGLNGAVIVEGVGSYCFLAEILTTLEAEADTPDPGECDRCGRCVRECPGKAICGDGRIDAGKCINYLTIEKKSDFTGSDIEILKRGKFPLFGCDICMRVCPHNRETGNDGKSRNLDDIFPQVAEIETLTPEKILGMEPAEFKQKFSRSPLYYAGLKRLRRNAGISQNGSSKSSSE